MLKIRISEERVIQVYPSDKIQSPVHLSIGQEAVVAGLCRALRPTDHVHGTYRSPGLYIAKGGDLKGMFAELYGKDTGCARGKGGSMHLVAPEVGLLGCSAIVASTIPVATGDALASRMRRDGRVVAAFFGDGAIDEGVFFESVNFAVLKNLPIVYVLENNRYAIHSKVSDRHKQTNLYRLVEGLGLKGRRYEGDDAMRVYRTMSQAVERARAGRGPALLEYMTYRRNAHVGLENDYHEAYRYPREEALALKKDPVKTLAAALIKRWGVKRKALADLFKDIEKEVDEAVAFAELSPFPAPERLHADVFKEAEAA
mgnify:CR=1 FL=1